MMDAGRKNKGKITLKHEVGHQDDEEGVKARR
jgi:hypothetical protein